MKLLFKFLCRTREKENTATHTRQTHTLACLISNSRQTFHSQFLGILCEYILSLTRFYVECQPCHTKPHITVFQEQQNGETNISGLLTTFKRRWAICGGSRPEVVSFSSSITTADMHGAPSPLIVSCCPRRSLPPEWGDTATSCHPGPALSQPTRPSGARRRCKGSAHQLPTLTPPRQVVGELWFVPSALSKCFYLKNHLPCYTARQKSLRLW